MRCKGRTYDLRILRRTSSVAPLGENLAAALRIELSMNDEFPLQRWFEPLRFVSQVQLPS